MKKLLILAMLLAQPVFADSLPHLELDMTGAEYQSLTQNLTFKSADPLRDILNVGTRNLQWLEAINQAHPSNPLDLWTPENTLAFPITAPGTSNRSIVQKEYSDFLASAGAEFKSVVLGQGSLPNTTLSMTETVYLDQARKLDRIYQRASRWLLQEPSLFAYQQRAWMDLRGFYNLSQVPNLDAVLLDYKNQPSDKKQFLESGLVQICVNNRNSNSNCASTLKNSIQSDGHPLNFKKRYWSTSQELWSSFFELGARRSDVQWTATEPNRIVMPFRTPASLEIKNWFELNVEDEWKVLPVRLDILFQPGARANVLFSPGATPHVNGLGGDTITMDSNRPLQQFSTRWTIRHEFGHVIGFPDCYLEFYDADQGIMINYQLNITNLMCSRRGHLQPLHIEELKKNYFKN